MAALASTNSFCNAALRAAAPARASELRFYHLTDWHLNLHHLIDGDVLDMSRSRAASAAPAHEVQRSVRRLVALHAAEAESPFVALAKAHVRASKALVLLGRLSDARRQLELRRARTHAVRRSGREQLIGVSHGQQRQRQRQRRRHRQGVVHGLCSRRGRRRRRGRLLRDARRQ